MRIEEQRMRRNVIKSLFLIVVCAILLSSCGERRKAKATIETFLSENMKSHDYYADLYSLDSTWRVSDVALEQMRRNVDPYGIYKGGVKFAERDKSGKLMFMRGMIIMGNDTFRQTFYLNPDLKGIVAIKEN